MCGARLRRACANEWRLRDDARGTPKGWHEARIGNRSITRKAFAWPAPGDERRFVLERRPAVALRCDPKSFEGRHASAQSNFANDSGVDTAEARWCFQGRAA